MDLSEIRNQIDAVDDQLLQLFLRRMDLMEAVAAYKHAHGLPILNEAREQEILARVRAEAGKDGEFACQLFSKLFELARTRQTDLLAQAHRAPEE